MNRISDLALDLGIFALNNELESGSQLSALVAVGLEQRILRVFKLHQENLRRAKSSVGKRRILIEASDRATSRRRSAPFHAQRNG